MEFNTCVGAYLFIAKKIDDKDFFLNKTSDLINYRCSRRRRFLLCKPVEYDDGDHRKGQL